MVHWDELRSKYYESMGWDRETGKPLPDTLRKFGLDTAMPELWGSGGPTGLNKNPGVPLLEAGSQNPTACPSVRRSDAAQ